MSGRYHWSNMAHPAKFFALDAKAGVPWILLPLFPSWPMFFFTLAVTAFYVYLIVGPKMSDVAYFRYLGVKFIGRHRNVGN